jgi:streptomycin 6-kinase
VITRSDDGTEQRRIRKALQHWHCQPDGAVLRGGMSVVVPVRRSDERLMLKLLPSDAAVREALALSLFPRSASVVCLDHHADLGALLLERLTPESLVGADIDRSITIQADLARRLAVPAPPVPGDAVRIERLAADGWRRHLDDLHRARPSMLPNRVIDFAREVVAEFSEDRTTSLTHGDLHSHNVHRDRAGNWRALDPAPRIGTIAYESHTVIVERVRFGELIAGGERELRRRLTLFGEVAGVSPDAAARLCQARAVSSALYEAQQGHEALAAELAWMAEALTG